MKDSFLNKLLHPESIAIAGASNNPMKMGTMHALSIIKDGFSGELLPIHPKEETVLGLKAYKNPADLPYAPDLALFVLPAAPLPSLLEEFGKIGTKYAIIITAGFKETGSQGERLENQLLEIARKYEMRFIGPNCMGVINHSINLNTTVTQLLGEPGHLGLISQSGTYVTQALRYLDKRGIHFSKAISVGNEADINVVDVLKYLGQDPQTRAIALYLETIRDIPGFKSIASSVVKEKPILVQYVGGSKAGARAGLSHTGAMAGYDPFYNGLFKQAGAIRVFSVEELYETGFALANQPRIKGKRIGIVTNSGGPGSAIADTLERQGCSVPELSQDLQKRLRPMIHEYAPCKNPVDLTFSLDTALMTESIPKILMQSGEIDGIVLHGANSSGFMKSIYPHLADLKQVPKEEELLEQMQKDLSETVGLPYEHQVPMTISSFFDREDNYTTAYQDKGIPVLSSPEKAAKVMAALVHYKEIAEKEADNPPELPNPAPVAEEVLKQAQENEQAFLDEFSAKKLLSCYGIKIPKEQLVHSPEQARTAAEAIGYPVAIKACHPQILHKTEENLIQLNLNSAEEVNEASRKIQESAGRKVGLLVAQMISGKREFLLGISYDSHFGHCLGFGLGGIFTESLNDIAFRTAPIGTNCALEMMNELKSSPLLKAYRGMPEVNKPKLAWTMQQLSLIPLLHPQIKEIDINPLLIHKDEPFALDALIGLFQT